MTAGLSERPPVAIPVGPPVPGFPPDDLGDLAPEGAEAGPPRPGESDNRVLIDSLVARAVAATPGPGSSCSRRSTRWCCATAAAGSAARRR